jgi:hypothetical protein
MLIFHSLPRAARRMVTRQLLAQLRGLKRFQYYEPMRLYTPQPKEQRYRILFDEADGKLFRVDPYHLRNIELCFGVFSARKFDKRSGDFSFTVLRKPIDRFYSIYYYANYRLTHGTVDPEAANLSHYKLRYPEMAELLSKDVKTFVRRFLDCGGDLRFDRNDTIYGPIEESFFVPRNLADHDVVGITELMDDTLGVLNRALGTDMRNEGITNRNPVTERPRYGEAELERLFEADTETYHHYRDRLLATRADAIAR